jgi:hypothetical protein
MKNSKTFFYLNFVVMCLLVIPILSCGDGETNPGVTGTQIPLTQQNATQAIAGVAMARDALFFTEGFLDVDLMGGLPAVMVSQQAKYPAAGNLIYKAFTLGDRSLNPNPFTRVGMIEGSSDCSGGGSVSISMSWDGPDDFENISEIVDLQLSADFTNCKEDTLTMDGSMDIDFVGPLDDFTEVEMYLDLSYEDPSEDIDITMNDFSMAISGDFDAEIISYMVDGTVTGYFYGDSIDIGYDEFFIDLSMVEDDVYMTMSGGINPPCLNAWLTVTTNSPIVIRSYDDCPSAGDASVSSGGNTARAVFQSNFQIDIYYNGVLVDTLNSCEDLDGMCTM